MSGWLASCNRHMKRIIKDIDESVYFFNGMCETDDKIRCDFPKCGSIAKYEIYWGDRPYTEIMKEIKAGSFVLWDGI